MSRKINIKDIRSLLENRLASLRERLTEMNETLREPEDIDFEEQAAELDDDDVLERLAHAGKTEAVLIMEALKRIEAGTYGKCATCGKEIPEGRLKAIPEAENCVDCAKEKR